MSEPSREALELLASEIDGSISVFVRRRGQDGKVSTTALMATHREMIVAALRAAKPERERVEIAARAIAQSYGYDPDEMAPTLVMCTADNKPVPYWQVYEEQAEAVIRALKGDPA